MNAFDKLFPLYKIENDCILSKQGDCTLAFQLSLPELFVLSDREYEAFHQVLIKAIKVLPTHSIFHKQDWFLATRHQANFSNDNSFLTTASERFFHERPYLDHQCYLFLTRKSTTRGNTTSMTSSLFNTSLIPKEIQHPQKLQEFFDGVGQLQRILEDSGFVKMKKLTAHDLIGTKETTGLLERYCFLTSKHDHPIIKDIHLQNELRIGDNLCQLYSLADVEDLPSLCGSRITYDKYSSNKIPFSVGFASPLGQLLACNHMVNQYVFIQDVQKTIRMLESKRLRLQSLSTYSRENAIARDATNDFLNEAIASQRLPIKAHFNVLVWSDSQQELKELKTQVSSAFAQMDATAKQETDGAPQIFWAGLPGNEADFPMNDTFDTFAEQATCFFNLETGYQSSLSPVGIRLGDRLTGKPVHVDISDEPVRKGICTNRNKFILGPSGSGKSFLTNHIVRSYYEQGTHIVLVDVGHSYKGLCDLVNGYYFTYDESNPLRFNPFHIAPGDSLDTEKKESIKTLLLALWKKDNETFNRSEYVALSIALKMYYDLTPSPLGEGSGLSTEADAQVEVRPACRNFSEGRGFNSFYEFLRDEFVLILKEDKVKEKDFDIENFLYVLRPYYKGGEFDYLLNATENLDLLNKRFIVFELDNIKDHPILFPVVTLIIMEVFISKMRKLKGIRKMILIEEAWKAIAKEGMAEYIKYLFKTVRKFYGEAIVVTQEVEDIISSPVVKQAIINNSDCKILLDQSKYQNKFEQIEQLLGLTEKEKALVLSINKANDPTRKYKEVFISLGGVVSKVYATEVSLEEYLTYTTEESEKLKVQQYTQKWNGDIRKAITELASDMRTVKA
jgi:conjugation system TraG family ATPase